MRLGAILSPANDLLNTDQLKNQATDFEKSGVESLWAVQAIGRGFTVTDPLITLAVAATVTKVELGTAILQLPLYEPMDLAHRVYSVMQLAQNRFVLGLGTGSTESDFIALNKNYESRFEDFDEHIKVLRAIFANNGNSVIKINNWKKVEGGPPLYLGTWGQNVKTAAAQFDGWIASAHYRTPDQVIEALNLYKAAGGKRAIVSTIQIDKKTDLRELKDKLIRFSEAGFDDAIIMLLPGAPSPDSVRNLL